MGNSPSTSQKPPAGHSPHQNHDRDGRDKSRTDSSTRREPRRRESIHALSGANPKATPAPPSASLTSAIAQPVTTTSSSTSPTQSRNIPKSSHSRNRSQTVATPRLEPLDRTDKTMGNAESKGPQSQQREPSRSRSLRGPAPPEIDTGHSPASRPVDVPGTHESQTGFEPSPLDPTAPASEAYQLPPASYSRPPRLPLPIEEEDHTPGSPILSPVGDHDNDVVEEIDHAEGLEDNRRGSVISSTVDEEEEPDEFAGYMPNVGPNVPKVPTVVEWRDAGPNDKIYVTGTFTDWQRKFRLHHNGPSKHPNTLSATLQLPPGTHHVKFLVNNDMLCSDHLPTTVDFTNILVNYIEVAANNLPASGQSTGPVAVPAPTPAPSRPLDIRPRQLAETSASPVHGRPASPMQKASAAAASPSTPARASPRPAPTPPPTSHPDSRPAPSPTTKQKTPAPPRTYTAEIPAYLVDLDTWPIPTESSEQSSDPSSTTGRYQRAAAVTQNLPTAPSLPLFLSKSILNGTTPMKDDSSVLIMPNHTVLNHLATTNIKQGVLATSATTRYKKKFLTTIMYKPRSEDGD